VHGPSDHDGDGDDQVGRPARGPTTPRRPILLALTIALATTIGVWWFVNGGTTGGSPRASIGAPAPPIVGTTLDGAPFDLASYAGRPVVLNFWGPSCVPCRDEFPLLLAKESQYAADGLAIVGVLTDDPIEPARLFVADYGATWPTVEDPGKVLKTTYRVAGRPQTYFIDSDGVLRSIQIGEVGAADFDRQYAKIAP
jgi:cytochrome c biogenesis protein CcmG, thiol:disulfide interchange protein DsbE